MPQADDTVSTSSRQNMLIWRDNDAIYRNIVTMVYDGKQPFSTRLCIRFTFDAELEAHSRFEVSKWPSFVSSQALQAHSSYAANSAIVCLVEVSLRTRCSLQIKFPILVIALKRSQFILEHWSIEI